MLTRLQRGLKNENLPGCADLTRSVAGIITSKVKNLVICLALLEVLKTMRQFPAAAELPTK